MRLTLIIMALWGLANCKADESLAAYGATGIIWQLHELDGQPFAARATLSFPEEGKLSGDAPCNHYFGAQTAPYPWFKAENVAATRRACPDLATEATYLAALSEMSLAEVAGGTLILSNDAGREMVFRAGN